MRHEGGEIVAVHRRQRRPGHDRRRCDHGIKPGAAFRAPVRWKRSPANAAADSSKGAIPPLRTDFEAALSRGWAGLEWNSLQATDEVANGPGPAIIRVAVA